MLYKMYKTCQNITLNSQSIKTLAICYFFAFEKLDQASVKLGYAIHKK